MRKLCSLFLLIVPLLLNQLVATAAPPAEPETRRSTPQLIQAALAEERIDQDTANLYLAYALFDHEKLPPEFAGDLPWRGTEYLAQLQTSTKTMRSTEKQAAVQALLSTVCDTSSGSLSLPTATDHFYVEFGTVSGGLDIGDYTTSLETTWGKEITAFGWAAPPVKTTPAGQKYHVRLDDLGSGLYGYVSTYGTYAGYVGDNPNTTWDEGDADASCMVLNSDYSTLGGQAGLDATTAHEFNHSIQFGLGAIDEVSTGIVEAATTWMEDEAMDYANDNYNYLWPTNFTTCLAGLPNDFGYPYWIIFRGMVEQYGTTLAGGSEDVMQSFWERVSRNEPTFTALNAAFGEQSDTLADAFHRYAIAVKFNKPCSGGYAYPYCLEEGAEYVDFAGETAVQKSINAVDGSVTGSIGDNYALNWVSLPANAGDYQITLQNTAAGGQLRASVVCDTGAALTMTAFPAIAGAGQTVTLNGFNSTGCAKVVAVITNQSQTGTNPTSCTSRSYRLSTITDTQDAPVIASLPNQRIEANTSLPQAIDLWAYTTDAQDADDALTFSISNSPAAGAGVSIPDNRYISITPQSGWTGSTRVDILVTDTDSLTATGAFTATVSDNTPPVISSLPDQWLETTTQATLDLTTYTGDDFTPADSLVFTITNTPVISAGVSITAARYLNINPVAGWSGSTRVDLQARDGGGLTASGSLTITVTEATSHTVFLPLVFKDYVPPLPYNETVRWNMSKINAPTAWNRNVSGAGVTIAVVDTGVDLTHPDLAANLVGGTSTVSYTPSPDDDYGHGTHVAGIAAGIANNGGIMGVAPGAKIMPVKVLDYNGSGYMTDVAEGVTWAADHGADVINLSLSGVNNNSTLANAVTYAYNKGALIVAAAGNCGDYYYYLNGCSYEDQPSYPAALDNVVAVASTTSYDGQSSFSTQGIYVDIAAPGSSIYSSYPSSTYATESGTSQAAPHVAGLAALIWQKNPGFTAQQVRTQMQNTTVDLGSAGWDEQFGYGRISAATLGLASASAAVAPAQSEEATVKPAPSGAPYAPGEVLVKLNPGVTLTAVMGEAMVAGEVYVTEKISALGVQRLAVPAGREEALVEAWQNAPGVEFAELNYRVWAQ